MESREILKEFAGKLAGLSAAAKVVAIAGAVSAYSGTGHAAAEGAVKAENRITAGIAPTNGKVASDSRKSEEVSAKKEEPAKTQVSEAAVKTLLASKKKETTASGAKIAPKIQEKVEIYEPKKTPTYNTKYYQAPGTKNTSKRPTRSRSSSFDETPSYPSYKSYNEPTAPSYAKTSDDSVFGENASSSRSTSVASRSPRRPYRDWGRTHTNSDTYRSIPKDTGSKGKADGIGRSGASTASSLQSTGFTNFGGFGDGSPRPSAPKHDAKTEKALKIAEEIERGEKKLVTSIEEKRAIELQQEVSQGKKKLVDADEAERINEQQANVARAENEVRQLRNELQVVRAENLELKGRQGGFQQQAANLQILPQANVAQAQPQAQFVAQPVQQAAQVAVQAVQPVVQPNVAPAVAVPVVVNPQANVAPQANVVAQMQPVQPVVQPVDEQAQVIPNAAVPPPPPLEAMGIVRVVPEQANVGGANAIPPPPPPPPPPPGADRYDPNVVVGGGQPAVVAGQAQGVPPPPPPPPPPPGAGAAGQPVVVAGQAQGVPPPPPPPPGGVPPPPGVANTNGVPPPPGMPVVAKAAPKKVKKEEPKFDDLFTEMMEKVNKNAKDEQDKKNDEKAAKEKAESDLFFAIEHTIKDVKSGKGAGSFAKQVALIASNCKKKTDPYIFADGCIRVLENALKAAEVASELEADMAAHPNKYKGDADFEKREKPAKLGPRDDVYKPVMMDAVAYLLEAVVYFSDDDQEALKAEYGMHSEDVPNSLPELHGKDYYSDLFSRCCATYNIQLGKIRTKVSASVKDPNLLEKCKKVLSSLRKDNDVEQAVVGQCSPLDKAIFNVFGEKSRKEGWFSNEEIETALQNQRNIVEEKNRQDLDNVVKDELKKLVSKLNTVFWITETKEDFVKQETLKSAEEWFPKYKSQLSDKCKKVKVGQLKVFMQELRTLWDKGSARFENKGSAYKDGTQKKALEMFLMAVNLESKEANLSEAKKKYEIMKLYPIASKIRKSVMNGEKALSLQIDGFTEEELQLMKDRRVLVKKLLKSVLKLSKNTKWDFSGEWVSEFLPDLNSEIVKILWLGNAVFKGLHFITDAVYPELKEVKFTNVTLTDKALRDLKNLKGMFVSFDSVKSTQTLYKGEGVLKMLADNCQKKPEFKNCSWVKDGTRPVEEAANPANPEQAVNVQPGRHQLRKIANNGVGGHGNRLPENNVFDRKNLKKVERKAIELKKANNAIAAEIEKIKENLQRVEAAERNDAILEQHKQMWRDNDEGKDIEIMLPLVMGLGDIFTTSAAAAKEAKKRDGDILFTGRFTDNLELGQVAVGAIVDNMRDNGVKSVKFAVDGLQQVAGNNAWYILDTFKHKDMNDNRNLAPDQQKHSLQSVEISGLAYGRFLEVLPDLKLEKLTFLGIGDDAWNRNESFGFNMTTRNRWMAIFRNTKAVDLSLCDFSEVSLSALRDILKAMKPQNGEEQQNGNDADHRQADEKVLLEDLALPETQNEQEQKVIQEIKNLVDELKGN